jgi:hypothetical protein
MANFLSKSLAATDGFLAWGPLASTGFRIHLSAFLLVNAILLAVNLLLTPDRLWFYWPLIGWGIGVTAHGLAEYYSGGRHSRVRARRARSA